MTIDTSDSPEARTRALGVHLAGLGITGRQDGDDPKLTIATDGDPVVVECTPRSLFGGQVWFFHGTGEPIAPADDGHLHQVVTAIKGRIAQAGRAPARP